MIPVGGTTCHGPLLDLRLIKVNQVRGWEPGVLTGDTRVSPVRIPGWPISEPSFFFYHMPKIMLKDRYCGLGQFNGIPVFSLYKFHCLKHSLLLKI